MGRQSQSHSVDRRLAMVERMWRFHRPHPRLAYQPLLSIVMGKCVPLIYTCMLLRGDAAPPARVFCGIVHLNGGIPHVHVTSTQSLP